MGKQKNYCCKILFIELTCLQGKFPERIDFKRRTYKWLVLSKGGGQEAGIGAQYPLSPDPIVYTIPGAASYRKASSEAQQRQGSKRHPFAKTKLRITTELRRQKIQCRARFSRPHHNN